MLKIVPYLSRHRDGIVSLIQSVYQEHGETMCLDGADGDLLEIPERYRKAGGEFVVLEDGPTVGGCHAVQPVADCREVCTFRRLYLAPNIRRAGWGLRLMHWAVDWSVEQGFRRVEFWSDTRFLRAHQFFEQFGFQRDGRTRTMLDGHLPYEEFFFWKSL